jgi:hypothetical protein
VTSAQTHDLVMSETEVRKRYVSWERGEPDREWSCLNLLARHAPGVAPTPLRRETDPDGVPVIVMERLSGEPLSNDPLTHAQTASLGRVIRQTYEVPFEAVLEAELPERLAGPITLPKEITSWLSEPCDLSQCQDPALVQEGVERARTWLTEPRALPEPRLVALGISDRKPANILWDGVACRLVDFEDSGQSDPAYEFADHIEHVAGRLSGVLDPEALAHEVGLSDDDRERAHAYRPLWASFWLVMLLPGNGGFQKNPPGTTEEQAKYFLGLLDSSRLL